MPPLPQQDIFGDISPNQLLTVVIGTSTLVGGSGAPSLAGGDGTAADAFDTGVGWVDTTAKVFWRNYGTAEAPDWRQHKLDINDATSFLTDVTSLQVVGATLSGTADAAVLTVDDQVSKSAASGFVQVAPSANVTGDGHAEASNNANVGGDGEANTSNEASVLGDGNATSDLNASVVGDGNADSSLTSVVENPVFGRAVSRLHAEAAAHILEWELKADASGVHLTANGLPTADPHVLNEVWSNGGVLTVSAG